MHFELLQMVTLAGDQSTPNEDRAGVGHKIAWIIDGATDLGPAGLMGARGGSAWLAMTADAAFHQAASL